MTTAEKAQIIVDMVRSYTREARSNLSQARISFASVSAAQEAWEREASRDDDPWRGSNPYTVGRENKAKEVDRLSDMVERYQEAEDLAISHFLSMIPDKEEISNGDN